MLKVKWREGFNVKRMTSAAVIALLMLFAAACGSGNSTSNTPAKPATPTAAAPAPPSPKASATESGTPFTANKALTVPGVSPDVNSGEVSFTKGSEANHILGKINGMVQVANDMACYYCMSTVRIAANLQVPAGSGLFFVRAAVPFPSGGSGEIHVDMGLESELPAHSQYWIYAGANGAVLKKQGAGFLLVSGTALLIDKPTSS